jgi:iron complex outermembrane receptor protein
MLIRQTRKGLLLLSAAIVPVPVVAQSNPAPSKQEGVQEAPVETDGSTIIVTGRAQKLYRVDETLSGRLPTAPLDSSQSITVITEQLIDDQGARDAQDLYRNISGVTLFSYAGVTARGFRQEETFFDGLRGNPYIGFAVPQLANIERVEFLKGPAGMLYGQTAPGGLFNYITKTPENAFRGEVAGIIGNGDRYGGSGEITGPIGGGFAARAGVFYEDRGVFRTFASSRTLIADGGLSFDFDGGRIIAQFTHYDQELDAHRLRGVPTDLEGNFLTSRRWNHNEETDFQNLQSNVAQLRAELEPAEGLTISAGIRYSDASERQQYHEPRAGFDSDGDGVLDSITRQFRDQARGNEDWSLGINGIWATTIGGLGNRLLAGYDYFQSDSTFLGRSVNGRTTITPGLPAPIAIVNPVYGLSNSADYIFPEFDSFPAVNRRQGFYLLDELTIGRLILTGGVRYDAFRDREFGDGFDETFSGDAWTYRVGAVYKLRDDISLFGQYATSFEPQSIFDQDPRAGGPFDPTIGKSFEGGIRTALFGGRVQSSLAAYQIKRTNVLQNDPRGDVAGDGIDDLIQFGEVTSKGIEFDLATDITPNWVLTLAYAYNDTRITGDNGGGGIGNRVGDRFVNAPEHQLGFWTRYQFPELGLAAALGGDYVSERVDFGNIPVQPYLVFDASLIYEVNGIRAVLRLDNIFDKTYAVSGFGPRAHFPGEPRSVFLEVGYAF